MIRAAFLVICITGPAHAPATWIGWRECTTDSDCEERVAQACIAGDREACAIVHEWHREACEGDDDHDDCAVFREGGG